jgi:hypothetical protein
MKIQILIMFISVSIFGCKKNNPVTPTPANAGPKAGSHWVYERTSNAFGGTKIDYEFVARDTTLNGIHWLALDGKDVTSSSWSKPSWYLRDSANAWIAMNAVAKKPHIYMYYSDVAGPAYTTQSPFQQTASLPDHVGTILVAKNTVTYDTVYTYNNSYLYRGVTAGATATSGRALSLMYSAAVPGLMQEEILETFSPTGTVYLRWRLKSYTY